MKILLIAKPWKGGLGRYFFLALQDMFPGQVEWISTRPKNFSEWLRFHRDPAGWWQALLQKIEKTPCNAAFFIGWRNEFRALRPQDHYTLYLVDDVCLGPNDADAFGRVFLSDPGYESELLSVLPASKYGGILPFAHYPALHEPGRFNGPKQDICFIGNRDAKRDPYLAQLFAHGFQTRVIGNYFLKSPLFWQHPLSVRRAVTNEEMGEIYARRKIALNIHARVVREGTNMRTFECAGYGIPQIVEHRPGIENYFTPEKEILTFRDADEMIAQIRSLLNDPAKAGTMAAAARLRVLAEHTYHHRSARALSHLLPQHFALRSENMEKIA